VALREGAAWLDLAGRGLLRVTGEDRARLLHALSTNHVDQLRPGQGCYALFLNAQGHILADAHVLRRAGDFLLDSEPETGRSLAEHIDKHIIADDVTVEDLTAQTAVLCVEGPRAGAVLEALGAPRPEAVYHHAPWEDALVARLSATGLPGWRIFVPLEQREALAGQLESAGAVRAEAEAARVARLEVGKPRYGEDFTDQHLPQETQLLHAVHFSKGCYLGQEIVERIRSQGHVRRLLMPLTVDAPEAPAPGAKILAGEREAGEITSAAFSPALAKVVALGFLHHDALASGARLTLDGASVEVSSARPPEC
jgi:aminomethyltransferase